WLLSFSFCFQAEDGIRDFHVTGVQTCALPISGEVPLAVASFDGDLASVDVVVVAPAQQDAVADGGGAVVFCPPQGVVDLPELGRSEERRVGKEWRAWGGAVLSRRSDRAGLRAE